MKFPFNIDQHIDRKTLVTSLLVLFVWENLIPLLKVIVVSFGLWCDNEPRVSLEMPPIEVIQEDQPSPVEKLKSNQNNIECFGIEIGYCCQI